MNLDLNHHSIIFQVLWGANQGCWCKLCVAIQGAVSPGSSGFLKSTQISIRHDMKVSLISWRKPLTSVL